MPNRRSLKDRLQADPNWPSCYRSGEHPGLSFDRACTKCKLSNMHHTPPQRAVAPTAPDDLSQVKLIVISDYPGPYETELGFSMVDNRLLDGQPGTFNAGASIRSLLNDMFGLDTYSDVYWSNAVRCQRGENEVVEAQVKCCSVSWLGPDFRVLDSYCPQAPVLIAGTHAFRACKAIDPDNWDKTKGDLHAYRRKVNTLLRRPMVVSINPAPLGRSIPHLETGIRSARGGTFSATGVYRFPLLEGTAEWHVRKDLEFLRPYLDPSQCSAYRGSGVATDDQGSNLI